MLKLIVTFFAIIAVSQSHVVEKRLLGINIPSIPSVPTLDTTLLTTLQGTFGSLSGNFDTALNSLLGGQLNQLDFITQLIGNLNGVSTQFPFQILSNGLINFPLGNTCSAGAFNPTADLSSNCVSKVFPQINVCLDAIKTPNLAGLLNCGRLVQGLNTGVQACIGLVQSQTEENFIGCATLVANMITPNADALLSIYQQCKPLASTLNAQTLASCAFEIVNGVQTFGAQSPILSQISNLQGLTECVTANVQSPLSLILNCQSTLLSTLQNVNINSVTNLISQFLQCKSSGGSVAACSGKFIDASRLLN